MSLKGVVVVGIMSVAEITTEFPVTLLTSHVFLISVSNPLRLLTVGKPALLKLWERGIELYQRVLLFSFIRNGDALSAYRNCDIGEQLLIFKIIGPGTHQFKSCADTNILIFDIGV